MQVGIPIPVPLVLLLVIAGLIGSGFGYRHLRRTVPARYVAGMALLRTGLLILLGLLLLAPYHERRRPDPTAFRLVILADVSGSMRVRDCTGGRARLDVLRDWLTTPDVTSPIQALRTQLQTEIYLITDRAYRYMGGDFGILPGATALGEMLAEAGDGHGHGSQPLGAVLLISDGNSNVGRSPIGEALRYAALGIPVSGLGVGTPGRPPDLAIRGSDAVIRAIRGQPVDIVATAVNTFADARKVRVTLASDEMLLETRELTLAPGGAEHRIAFSVMPERTGTHVYRLHLEADPPDFIPETDTAHVAVEVRDPDIFKILYLGVYLGWEYPFLRTVARDSDQLEWSAVLRLAPGIFRAYGEAFEHEDTTGFPSRFETYREYDAVIIDSRAVPLLDADAIENLQRFVGTRGGGLLCVGPFPEGDGPLHDLLPVVDARLDRAPGRQFLTPDSEVVFPEHRAAALSIAPGLFMPSDIPFFGAPGLKRGARPALTLGSDEVPVLAVQRYGSGRTAYLGIEDTWRWHLASHADAERHRTFWTHLLVWLGSAGKPRVHLPFAGRRLDLDQSATLAAEVLGADFLPARDAHVTARIQGPGNFRSERVFAASGEALGEFRDLFTPTRPGEYRADVRVRLPDGETLERSAFFMAAPGGIEMRDLALRDDVLRDIARVSGGIYRAYDRIESDFMPPVSSGVPDRVERVNWGESGWFLAVLVALAAAEWYGRRRIGLK